MNSNGIRLAAMTLSWGSAGFKSLLLSKARVQMDSDLQFLSFWRIFPDQLQTDLFELKRCPQKSACFRLFRAKLSISINA